MAVLVDNMVCEALKVFSFSDGREALTDYITNRSLLLKDLNRQRGAGTSVVELPRACFQAWVQHSNRGFSAHLSAEFFIHVIKVCPLGDRYRYPVVICHAAGLLLLPCCRTLAKMVISTLANLTFALLQDANFLVDDSGLGSAASALADSLFQSEWQDTHQGCCSHTTYHPTSAISQKPYLWLSMMPTSCLPLKYTTHAACKRCCLYIPKQNKRQSWISMQWLVCRCTWSV